MESTSPKFRTKKGRLTAYSFACGYIEVKSTDETKLRSGDLYTELWHEGAVYHVRQHDYTNDGKRVFWESYEKLAEARAKFNEQPGKIKRSVKL